MELERLDEFLDESRRLSPLTPEHPADLAHGDLDADTGQEADEHAAGQEVGDEAELEQARRDQQDRAHEGGERRHLDVLGGLGGLAHCHQPGGQDRRRRRVRADDQVARRPEDREEQDRQEQRVQTRDHRRSGDLRVAHHLGDGEGGERGARDRVSGQARRIEGQEAAQEHGRPALLRGHLGRRGRA